MFDVGASELLLIVIVAIVVIGPKDMPVALRTAGRWIGKIRRMSGYFRTGIETMIREAELEEMERKWREQNEAIMKAHPGAPDGSEHPAPASAEAALPPPTPTLEAAPEVTNDATAKPDTAKQDAEPERAPQLPLTPP